jgi:uncharacterized protein (TIGR04222 family)
MDLLSNNSVLDMPGPNFLVFYGFVALAVIVAASVVIRLDPTSRLPPRAPAVPDPYEIAYLRGGVGAVIETAIYALKRRGAIEAPSAGRLARVPGRAGAANAIEAGVLTEIGGSATIASVVRSPSLRADVQRACEVFRDRLAWRGLLMAPGARPIAYAVGLGAAAALAASASTKPTRAFSRRWPRARSTASRAACGPSAPSTCERPCRRPRWRSGTISPRAFAKRSWVRRAASSPTPSRSRRRSPRSPGPPGSAISRGGRRQVWRRARCAGA